MELASLSFLYLLLPAAVLVMWTLPARLRPYFLLLLSAFLYYSQEGANILLPLSVILFDYVMARLLEHCGGMPRLKKAVLICSVAKSAALIVLYDVMYQLYGVHYPLGIDVFCLTSTGYVIDCYRNFTVCEHNAVHVALMSAFFPKLYAGPVVYASRTLPQFKNIKMTFAAVGDGICLYLRGVAKKVIIGDTVYGMFLSLRQIPELNQTTLSTWIMLTALALSVYFILSGYCDMARGVGQSLGIDMPDNFIYPYRSISINDFFSRFNVTINRFFRRHIYIQLGGAQGGVLSGVFNILLVTILMGLWFGINANMMLWGVYFTAFVMIERYLLGKYMSSIPSFFRWIYSMVVVLGSFAFLAGDTAGDAVRLLKMMVGIGGAAASGNTVLNDILYLLASNYFVLALAIVTATGLVGWLAGLLRDRVPRTWEMLSLVFHAGLLVVTTAFII